MTHAFRTSALAAALAITTACNPAQRDNVDTAAGTVESVTRGALAVLKVDMGRHAGPDNKISDETATFGPKDTIYASVNTTGTAREGSVVSKWLFPDGSEVEQRADSASTTGNLLFFITKPEGLPKGKYTFRVIVDGREVRSEGVTVQ
jgi:hypothetical protein